MKQSNLRTNFTPVFQLSFSDLFDACYKLCSSNQEPQMMLCRHKRLLTAFTSSTSISLSEADYIIILLEKLQQEIKDKFTKLNNRKDENQYAVYAVENAIAEGHTPNYKSVSRYITPKQFNKLTKHTQKYIVCDHFVGSVFTIYATCEEDLAEKLDNYSDCTIMQVPNNFQPNLDIQHKDA